MARNYGKACSRLPLRKHNQQTFIENKRTGCFVSSGSEPKIYCDECPHSRPVREYTADEEAKRKKQGLSFVGCEKMKNIKWRILPNGKLEARWSA